MSWPTSQVDRLIDAMVAAEGGATAFVRAVRCSIPSCADYLEARRIALTTISHAAFDFVWASDPTAFVRFLGGRWAPVGATNDPTNLNANWVPNVLALLRQKGVLGGTTTSMPDEERPS